MRFEAIFLDWDGTLIESLPLKIANAAALFADRFGVGVSDVQRAYARFSGVPRRGLFDEIASSVLGRTLAEDEFAELSTTFSRLNLEIIRSKGRLRPYTMEGLAALRTMGLRLFVSTSAAQDEMEPLAHHFGVARQCDALFGSRPGFSKGPDHVAFAAEAYGLNRGSMLGVGDDERDIDLFRAAEIVSVGITGTRSAETLRARGAALVIDRLSDLPDILHTIPPH